MNKTNNQTEKASTGTIAAIIEPSNSTKKHNQQKMKKLYIYTLIINKANKILGPQHSKPPAKKQKNKMKNEKSKLA